MTYDKINIMVPSYKRPKHLQRLVRTAMQKAANRDNLRFTACINENDTETINAFGALMCPRDARCLVLEVTDQPNLAYYFNKMYDETTFSEPGTLVSMLGDDMAFVTPGWDTAVLQSVNDHGGDSVTFCDDGYIAHGSCCVNMFTTRKVVEATKEPFMCPRFHADMIDVVWTQAAANIGILHYLSDVVIFHDHDGARQPNEWDETMKRLIPVRSAANAASNHEYARTYAAAMSHNLVAAGIGKWATI